MSQGYTRQYTSVVSGNYFSAASANSVGQACDAEFNTIARAFNQTTGHTHDGTFGQGPKLDGSKAIIDGIALPNGNLPNISVIKTSLDVPLIKSKSGSLDLSPIVASNGIGNGGTIDHVNINAIGDFSPGFPSNPLNVGALNICGNIGSPGKTFLAWNINNSSAPTIQYGRIGISYGNVGGVGHCASFDIGNLYYADANNTRVIASFSGTSAFIGGEPTGGTPGLLVNPLVNQDTYLTVSPTVNKSYVKISTTTGTSGASVSIGEGTLATNAIGGFILIPTCAGKPTGTPNGAVNAGSAAMLLDTTNHKLCLYDPIATAWYGVALSAL